jgi:hypothetical protein
LRAFSSSYGPVGAIKWGSRENDASKYTCCLFYPRTCDEKPWRIVRQRNYRKPGFHCWES